MKFYYFKTYSPIYQFSYVWPTRLKRLTTHIFSIHGLNAVIAAVWDRQYNSVTPWLSPIAFHCTSTNKVSFFSFFFVLPWATFWFPGPKRLSFKTTIIFSVTPPPQRKQPPRTARNPPVSASSNSSHHTLWVRLVVLSVPWAVSNLARLSEVIKFFSVKEFTEIRNWTSDQISDAFVLSRTWWAAPYKLWPTWKRIGGPKVPEVFRVRVKEVVQLKGCTTSLWEHWRTLISVGG